MDGFDTNFDTNISPAGSQDRYHAIDPALNNDVMERGPAGVARLSQNR